MTSRQLVEWSSFAFVALTFCLLLSFRPIPKIDDANDTGRYVHRLHESCKGYELDETLQNKELSYALFYFATSPACLIRSDGFFAFEAAAFLPLAFLLFSRWRNGTFLWACSLLLSVTGLELMTNALRQNFGMFIFFGAILLMQRHRAPALLLGGLAAVAHDSVLVYWPLLLWLAGARISKKMLMAGGVVMLLLVFAFYSQLIEVIQAADELKSVYKEIYGDASSISFILFITLPLYFVFFMRHLLAKGDISSGERSCVVYSTLILLICYFLFPAILYRFSIFAVALQIFMITRSEMPGIVAGWCSLVGSLVQLTVMLTISNHYTVLING